MNARTFMPRWCALCILVVPCIYFVPLLYAQYIYPESTLILGAQVSDVWNGLWSWNWIVSSITQGENPICHTNINYPRGGCLWPADVLGSIAMLILVPIVELPMAYTLWMYIQSVLLGVAGYLLYQEIRISFVTAIEQNKGNTVRDVCLDDGDIVYLQGILVAIFLQTGSFFRCALHNGSTEAWSLGWVILGCYGWLRVIRSDNKGWLWIFLVLFSSWYGVLAFSLFWIAHVCFVLMKDGSYPETRRYIWTCITYMIGMYVVWLCYAVWIVDITQASSDILAIKHVNDMSVVRRTIGSADLLSYIMPWKYDSPDFTEMSRFGEQFVHSTYVGTVVLLGLFFYRRKIKQNLSVIAWCIGFGVFGLLFSLGPVLVYQGQPLIIGNKGIPMVYIILERLPLFSHLTLLYRLGWIPAIASVIVLAFHITRKRELFVLMGCMVLDNYFLSPTRNIPNVLQIPVVQQEMFTKLSNMPEGAVMHYPLVGGREYLFLQTIHHKPVAGILNFPLNAASRKVYNVIEKYASVQMGSSAGQIGMRDEYGQYSTKMIQEKVSLVAKQQGIRYMIMDKNPNIMPDQYYLSVRKVRDIFDLDNKVMRSPDSRFEIIQLW